MEAKTQCQFQSCVRRRERRNARNDTKLDETYLPTILSKHELKDIYNADEFGLFYDKSLHYKGERCSGGKRSKVRLTGLAAGNATG